MTGGTPSGAGEQARLGVWRFGDEGKGEGATVVRCGPERFPYYWVLCPAAATLFTDEAIADCSIGIDCDWDAVHERAAIIINRDRHDLSSLRGASSLEEGKA